MHNALSVAIRDHKLVRLWYDPGVRVIEPHAFGYGSDGQLLLRAFQIEGASASGEHVNWKLFRCDRMRDVSHNGLTFAGPRPEYKRNDKAMKGGIICQL